MVKRLGRQVDACGGERADYLVVQGVTRYKYAVLAGELAQLVLTEQGMDLTPCHIEIHVVVGEHPGEALSDAAHLEEREIADAGDPPGCYRHGGAPAQFVGGVTDPAMISEITLFAAALTNAGSGYDGL